MARFSTHITLSSMLGAGYAGYGYSTGLPLTSCIVAGGLCGVAGMLPDLDSESGVPVRETVGLAAAVVPAMMLGRFEHMGLTNEEIVLASACIYLLVRFGLAGLFRRFTVHRGMWHSIPAALIAATVGYLVTSSHDHAAQLFKAGGIFLGFISHLLLDELNSVQIRRGKLRIKRSLGSACKLWGDDPWANAATYGKLVIVLALAFGDTNYFMRYFDQYENKFHTARELLEDSLGRSTEVLR